MIGEDALLLLADRLTDIDDSLEQAGFTSCLVDRDWMKQRSSADEWRDYLVYKREYAREAMLSSEPEKIEQSNPGGYAWRSADIADRVLRRFRTFGDAHALFLDASRRHLTKLTVAAQRLHKVLERASEADALECQRRFAEFDRRRVHELQQTSNADVTVQELYQDPRATWAAVQRLLVRMVTARVLGEVRVAGPTSIRLAPMAEGTADYIEFQLEGNPENLATATRGIMYLTAVHWSALAAPAPQQLRRLHIVSVLPREFSNYWRFASRAEFILCFTAWLHVATYATRALLAANWRLCD